MRKIKKCLHKAFFCLLAVAVGSSAFAAKKVKQEKKSVPEWVTVPSNVYPSDKYISYVGSANDRNIAEVNALNGLSSVFGQTIKSEANASTRMSQAKASGKVSSNENVQTFSQEVKRSVDVDNLIGVQVKDFWLDEANSTWYAVAVLDKAKALEIYSTMIKKNASSFSELKKNAQSDLYSFEGFACYDFAEDIAKENENHLKKVSVISMDSASLLKQYCPSSKSIHAEKMEIAGNIPIYVETVGDEQGRYKEAFYKAISECGFKGSYDASGRYSLVAKFEFSRSDTSDKKTVRCRYNCESYIFDSKKNLQIVPFTISGRESSVEYSEAKVRAEKKLVSKISSEFKEKLSDYLKNLVVE